LGWEGGGSAFGVAVAVLLLVVVSMASVMRLVSSSSARLRGLCIRGGERQFVLFNVPVLCCFCPVGDRVVGVCGSAVQTVCLGFGRGCWGWAGCPDLVLAFTVACGLGP
jgi:hypothetical protein